MYKTFIFIIPVLIYSQADKSKSEVLRYHYTEAASSFAKGDYVKAIQHWQEVLNIDPNQIQPPKMIEVARLQIRAQIAPLEKMAVNLYINGKFEEALKKFQELIAYDPQSKEYQNKIDILTKVVKITSLEIKDDKISRLIRLGTKNLIENNSRVALMCYRYWNQLTGDEKSKEFIELIKLISPEELAKEKLIEGIDLVEQKLSASLNYIYEAQYDFAIQECNDVLLLEPDNILAMKRLGSSYYGLKKLDMAKRIWSDALKHSPNDPELKKFLRILK